MEEAVDYLHNSLKRAKAALAEMNDCKTDFVEMAPKLAEVLPLPSGTLAYIEPPDGWFMAIEDLISAFTKMPIERGHSTSEEFSTARRQFVDACLIHYEDLRKAAKPETVADAKDEQEASLKAYLSLPKEILTLPESFERPFPLDAKNPELRQAFRRIDTAKRAAYYSERGHQYATAEIGKAPPRLAAVFRKLYAEPPVAVGELDQLLLKHGLEKSPLANAIRGEQAG